MPSLRDRILILLSAGIFLFFGAWLFADPSALAGIGIETTKTEGIIDLRATYGGLELGLAAFLLVAQARPSWHRAALLLSGLCIGGLGAGRLGGIILAGEGTTLMWTFLAIEAVGAAVLFWAYRSSSTP